MITTRQKEILNQLIECYSNAALVTSAEMARELSVTTKTIQNDIKSLNQELEKLGAGVVTVPGKGYQLEVVDEEGIISCMRLISDESEGDGLFDSKDERVKYIIGQLLFSRTPILSDVIAYETYVSRSQFSLDIKEVKAILQKYRLQIKTKSRLGLYVEGQERDKRLCLVKEQINCHRYSRDYRPVFRRKELGDVIISTLSKAKYMISDLDLKNLLIYMEISVWRIKKGFILSEFETDEPSLEESREWEIAQKIYGILSSKYAFDFNRHEIAYLATLLQSIRIFGKEDIVGKETDQVIHSMIDVIKKQFYVDFSTDLELKVNLSVHIMPLLIRARNRMLATNPLLSYIKQSMTLAYDMAVIAVRTIENHYSVSLNEDEAGYLAVYFSMALHNRKLARNDKRVLIITASRRSDAVLLRYNVMKYFAEYIRTLDLVRAVDLPQTDFDEYDVFFSTTELEKNILPVETVKISYFLTAQDRRAMEAVLTDSGSKRPVISYFRQDLFFGDMDADSREEVLSFLCEKMNEMYHYKENLYELVLQRESVGDTVFANGVALPHPMYPFTEETVVAAAILNKPVCWGHENANVVFLMNIKQDGEKEMELLYEFMSSLLQNKGMVQKLREAPKMETLAKVITQIEQQNAALRMP